MKALLIAAALTTGLFAAQTTSAAPLTARHTTVQEPVKKEKGDKDKKKHEHHGDKTKGKASGSSKTKTAKPANATSTPAPAKK